ncbi:MAG: methyltransferase [Gammaproteobacteria bacterium]|nr:methyltransferase [Gammaproteobacteria bacterium]
MEILDCPMGSFELARYPLRKKESLRAWDAADEYILHHLDHEAEISLDGRILILNDGFGALSVALAKHQPEMMSDSWLAQQATRENLQRNGIASEQVTLLNSMQALEGEYDLVLIKLPKSHAMLEEQLYKLRICLRDDTRIVAAAMAKNIHTNTLKLFEKILGTTTTSLAKKKARLVFCRADNIDTKKVSPYPVCYTLENTQHKICNHANVFSRDSLDIGTRFLLKHLPLEQEYQRIIDLGCGNGVVGLMAAEMYPEAEIIFADESFMAIASAKENFVHAFGEDRKAAFHVTDCLTGIDSEQVDLVINNPPFHQQHAVGDMVAWQMFQDARRVLKKGGEILVIGNRHLGYHVKLQKVFGNCTTVASNKKFVILNSIKR